MNLNITLKPMKYTAKTLHEIHRKISNGHARSFSSAFGDGLTKFTKDDTVRVYNLHKVNAKYKQERHKKTNTEKGFVKGQTKKSVLVREGQWIAYIYDFDVAMLKALGLKVTQNTRNFTLIKNKK